MIARAQQPEGERQRVSEQGVTVGKLSKLSKLLGGHTTLKTDQNLLALVVQRQRTEWKAMYMLLFLFELEYDMDLKCAVP